MSWRWLVNVTEINLSASDRFLTPKLRLQGAGFVQFALPADAAKAVLEYDGKILHGRKVQVRGRIQPGTAAQSRNKEFAV